MTKRLTYEETKKLLEREILGINGVHICIDNLSKHSCDEFIIESYNETPENIYFKVSRLNEPYKYYTIVQSQISEISNMSIKDILEAYDMGETNKIIEIYIDTDVENDVIGKEFAEIEGYDLDDGMRFILHKDKNSKYCKKILTVRDVGISIKLVANRGRPKKIS